MGPKQAFYFSENFSDSFFRNIFRFYFLENFTDLFFRTKISEQAWSENFLDLSDRSELTNLKRLLHNLEKKEILHEIYGITWVN